MFELKVDTVRMPFEARVSFCYKITEIQRTLWLVKKLSSLLDLFHITTTGNLRHSSVPSVYKTQKYTNKQTLTGGLELRNSCCRWLVFISLTSGFSNAETYLRKHFCSSLLLGEKNHREAQASLSRWPSQNSFRAVDWGCTLRMYNGNNMVSWHSMNCCCMAGFFSCI